MYNSTITPGLGMNKLDKVHETHSGDQIKKSREGFGKYFGQVYSRFLMISIRVPFLPQANPGKPSLFASFFQVYSRWRVCCNTDGFGQAIAGPPTGGSACFKVLVTRFQAGVTLVSRLKHIVLVQAYLNNSKLPYNRTSNVLYPLHFFYFFDFLFHLLVELLPGATRCRETHPRCAGRARHRRI